ncbi:MAG TPA: FliI/YscN family ATPase [Candidatus Binataceae bacterium]|jgi:FliI/YscN family ATPase|nr:FliI/YscN family ATPase [Candidatus Binataceae bacterium]
MLDAAPYIEALPDLRFEPCGKLVRSVGLLLEATGPELPIGAITTVTAGSGPPTACQVVGFERERLLLLALDDPRDLPPGSLVAPARFHFRAGPWMLGRILDGLGRALDGAPIPPEGERITLEPRPLTPMDRGLTSTPLDVGVRAINGLLTLGVGQKIGIFSMPGVGKSTLLGSMARGTTADVNVIALIGERGREAREFIHDILGAQGLTRSVIIVVPSDAPAPLRLKGACLASAIADYFRSAGHNVLLLMDSLTRVAMAQREIGLAIGEPPTVRGFPPSVFALIPKLVEQAGALADGGSITGIYTVLVHEDNDPIGELAKSVLDGHFTLSRELAGKGHFPAIELSDSISRVAHRVCSDRHNHLRKRFVELYARWREAEQLIALGSYHPGADRRADEAVSLYPRLESYLRQSLSERVTFEESVAQLESALGESAG